MCRCELNLYKRKCWSYSVVPPYISIITLRIFRGGGAHQALQLKNILWGKTPLPEFIDPVFTKTNPKRSFSLNRKRAFWLVFAKTGSIISGTCLPASYSRGVYELCTWVGKRRNKFSTRIFPNSFHRPNSWEYFGGRVESERRLEGQQFTKLGRKYQHGWLTSL
jgi:hypothetical protein